MDPDRNRVGIIGAGHIGQTMARVARRAGRKVVMANSRGPDSLTSVTATIGEGVTAGSVDEAADAAIVVLAVPWPSAANAVRGIAWTDQIVIDAMNDFDPSDLDWRTSSEVVADLVAPARVVKAANTLGAPVLDSDPHEGGGQRVLFLSGNDPDANGEVAALLANAGFFPIDLGGLGTGGALQQVHGPLAGVNLVRLP
jgi:hypothetical protein